MLNIEEFVTKFDTLLYDQIVYDFIRKNPGCTAAYLLEHEKRIRKKRLHTILPNLKDKGLISRKKLHGIKGRHIALYVTDDSPLGILSRELDEFENLYPKLLTKLKELIEKWHSGSHLLKPTYLPGSKGKKEYEYNTEPHGVALELITHSTLLLFETMRINILRTVMVWSRIIEDKYTREMLNFMVFSKLYQMQIKITEVLGDVTVIDKSALILSIGTELAEIKERIHRASLSLDRYEIKDEIEPILKFVKKIILTEMARYQIYSKSTRIKWNINDNEIQELAEKLAKENPTRSENESVQWDTAEMDYDGMMGR